jgi:hypothetical protein
LEAFGWIVLVSIRDSGTEGTETDKDLTDSEHSEKVALARDPDSIDFAFLESKFTGIKVVASAISQK